MEQKSRMYNFLMSLPFWWILLTIIYIALSFLNPGYITATIGLFVPIGIWNIYFSFTIIKLTIIFLLVLSVTFGGEWLIRKINMSPIIKIFVILSILFILTIVVDFIIWGGWPSLDLLKAGGKIKFP
jgi:hypothetical protein